MARKSLWVAAIVVISVPVAFWLLPAGREAPPAFAPPQPERGWHADPERALEFRDLALKQAKVWNAIDVRAVDFAANPPDPARTLSEPIVRCRYISEPAHGTTAKFDCALTDGEIIKVKYGNTSEIPSEIAASRLLAGLGFGADRMYLVPRLRCYGCLRTPFYIVWALDKVHAREAVMNSLPEDRYTDFEWVGIERHFEGVPIAVGETTGWAWFELEQIDPSRGASRAERDAFRLVAMLLAHWDNKAPNQRLVCQTAGPEAEAPCPRPFALIHDLGAMFGPNKVNLDAWRAAQIWSDRSRCIVSMKKMMYGGGTFPDSQISEAGRQLLARQLTALTDEQMTALFAAARFREFYEGRGRAADVHEWVDALRDKIGQIADGPACPD